MTELDPTTVKVIAGSPTEEDLAAVIAVLSVAIEEGAASDDAAPAGPTAWQRSQRSVRTPLVRGPGAWQRFGA